ncbi:unnamed protein product [Rhizoctonia solani]|nr:unnamed protein product [Rhizoctonia solani]
MGEISASLKDTGVHRSLNNEDDNGLIIEKSLADILLKGRAYFVNFPFIYCYDQNRIIFRVGEGPRYHQMTSIGSNPPEPQVHFGIGGIDYVFDQTGVLWYTLGEHWVQEVTYSELSAALSEVTKCIEANKLHSNDPDRSPSSESGMSDTDTDVPEEGPQEPSPNSDQAEVDKQMGDTVPCK